MSITEVRRVTCDPACIRNRSTCVHCDIDCLISLKIETLNLSLHIQGHRAMNSEVSYKNFQSLRGRIR